MPRIFSIKKRTYLHFDAPFHGAEALDLASNKAIVASWSFLPLIHCPLVHKRIKRVDGELEKSDKKREIYYASHRDAAIYTYYAHVLNEAYDILLNRLGLNDVPTAFRSNMGKCNIHYAQEVFEFIRKNKPCETMAYDVVKFFDNLDHRLLKERWARLIGEQKLPDDHYAVFKSVTQFSYVEREDIYKVFNISKHNPKANKRKRFCSLDEFKEKIREAEYIHRNRTPGTGIPQGTPISAVLSNLYMLQFDQSVSTAVAQAGGLYRRYCDDIICVVPLDKADGINKLVESLIHQIKLALHPDKTVRIQFPIQKLRRETIQYLGFTFDGERIFLRSVGLSRYYAKMRAYVNLAAHTRRKWNAIDGVRTPIKTRRLHVKYSYIGRRNFVSYAFKSSRLMNSAEIKNQLKPHWKKVRHQLLKVSED
jgi:hypothetical protein